MIMTVAKHPNAPYKYLEITENQQEAIFNGLLEGRTLVEICSSLGLQQQNISQFAFKDPNFAKKLRDTREMVMHNHVETLLTIADDCETIVDVHSARIKSDNIKWSASKIVPAVYGDNINLNVQHSLDLSSVLLAAENRVLPMLAAMNATSKVKEEQQPDTIDAVVVDVGESFEDLI